LLDLLEKIGPKGRDSTVLDAGRFDCSILVQIQQFWTKVVKTVPGRAQIQLELLVKMEQMGQIQPFLDPRRNGINSTLGLIFLNQGVGHLSDYIFKYERLFIIWFKSV
jgi:hypothetical protein